ncbi:MULTISPECIES: DUF1707 domain-containing protein [Actinoallomurus]|uniref:DUF1707 domain-containing protein n=1 Tax=Actinoallomurus TaxID=667113 RepID=UPI002091A742|nr:MULTISPECIES: DUF1707 domain-containing protein [Actinoallomurus]MCO5969503.1 DUF1707 domain-containing protein [Actinoallomurus soli]MCO5994698.1 DUF1707 domain-containing protein [Actinoallomurus rhizosphaericola]
MPLNPEIRASDADRDRVAAALREHCAQGRIAVDELNERLDLAYRARTLGDLQKVTSDLPEEDMYELPVPAYRQSTPARRPGNGLYRKGMRAGWATYASVNLVCIVIWLLTAVTAGAWYPWWIWVAGPWGALMLAGQLFGGSEEHR